MRKYRASGYSLIELSVVFTVIAFIIAAVTSALFLEKRAKLLSIMADIGKLNTAYTSFKQIYSALPGDMHNAQSRLGSTTPNSLTVQNGNGNGYIDNGANEQVSALQHLALAGYIKGNYVGTWAISSSASSYMLGPVKDTGYYFASGRTADSQNAILTPVTASITNSVIVYARIYDSNADNTIAWLTEAELAALTPIDTSQIDSKYDDGVPTTGTIRAADGSDTAGSCISGATYLTTNNVACIFGSVLDAIAQ
jgi:hypothetical protein